MAPCGCRSGSPGARGDTGMVEIVRLSHADLFGRLRRRHRPRRCRRAGRQAGVHRGQMGWPDRRLVLCTVSVEIAAGQVTTLIGPSGNGKSTLLHCMNLLEVPDTGSQTLGAQAVHFRPDVRSTCKAWLPSSAGAAGGGPTQGQGGRLARKPPRRRSGRGGGVPGRL
ncbi:MAG: ATP-binding cassette domain-containing protein [Burkholderiaceae bacterium]